MVRSGQGIDRTADYAAGKASWRASPTGLARRSGPGSPSLARAVEGFIKLAEREAVPRRVVEQESQGLDDEEFEVCARLVDSRSQDLRRQLDGQPALAGGDGRLGGPCRATSTDPRAACGGAVANFEGRGR